MADLSAEYRLTLEKEFRNRKARNSRYSIRAFASALGMDGSFLSKLMRGRALLSLDLADGITRKLALSDIERKEFLLSAAEEQKCHALYLIAPDLTECDPALDALNKQPQTRTKQNRRKKGEVMKKISTLVAALALTAGSSQAAELTLECRGTANEVLAKTSIEVLDDLVAYEGMAYSKVLDNLMKATPKVKSIQTTDTLKEAGKPVVELANHGARLEKFDLNVTVVEYAAGDEEGGMDSDGTRVILSVLDFLQVTDWNNTTRGSFPKTVNAPQAGDTLFAEYILANPLSDVTRVKVVCTVSINEFTSPIAR